MFSPDGTLISASAAPNCGSTRTKNKQTKSLRSIGTKEPQKPKTHSNKNTESNGGKELQRQRNQSTEGTRSQELLKAPEAKSCREHKTQRNRTHRTSKANRTKQLQAEPMPKSKVTFLRGSPP